MTIAEQLKHEGMQQGMQQREHEMELNMLRKGKFTDEDIVQVAHIDSAKLAELKKQLH